MPTLPRPEPNDLNAERHELLQRVRDWLETPLLVLGFVWLGLLVWELAYGLTPALETLGTVIWVVFVVGFLLEFFLAPHKLQYLRTNWLTVVSLLIPALRVFRVVRIFRVLRVARGVRLVKVVGSLNRGMKALGASMSRRGFGYVVLLTLLVTFAGAAGMLAFERETATPGAGTQLDTYGEALWWTAMLMTTLGSEYWPQTPEGRALCILLALYAFAVFGYVTATLATFFVGRDAANPEAEMAGGQDLAALQTEVRALQQEIRLLRDALVTNPAKRN
jgi:voltage-gated potassium channel